MPTGSIVKHPAGAVHFDGARDAEVVVQIVGLGPSTTKSVVEGEDEFGMPHPLK